MKKALIFLLFMFILAGCTSKAYTENLNAGKEAMKAETYDEAINLLSIAKEEEDTDEVNSLLELAELMNESSNLLHQGEFEASIHAATRVVNHQTDDPFVKGVQEKAQLLITSAEESSREKEEIHANIIKGKTLMEEKKFDEAYAIFEIISGDEAVKTVPYYEDIRDETLQLMNDTIEQKEQLILEQEQKRIEEEKRKQEEERRKQEEKKAAEEASKPLNHQQAVQLVKEYLSLNPNPNIIFEYDHDNENGDYVIHVYEVVIDDPVTKEGHTATYGWYAVDPINRYVYDNMAY